MNGFKGFPQRPERIDSYSQQRAHDVFGLAADVLAELVEGFQVGFV
jgi:hypothetical protein